MDQLCQLAVGIALGWEKIPGLTESVGRPETGVVSNYSFDTVSSTWEAIRTFRGGTALFTEPTTPISAMATVRVPRPLPA